MALGPAFACSWTPLPKFGFGSDHECLGTCLPSLTNMRLSQHRKKALAALLILSIQNTWQVGMASLRLRVAEAHLDKIGILVPRKGETSLSQNSTILPGGSHKGPHQSVRGRQARHFIVRWLKPICKFVKVNFLIR